MKIALEAAKGLGFLHEAEKPVIYRDFKASNILLDSVSIAFLFSFFLVCDFCLLPLDFHDMGLYTVI